MRRSVRAITVNPQLWEHDRVLLVDMLEYRMRRYPADAWVIVIGPPGSAERIMDNAFVYGPAETPIDSTTPDPSWTEDPGGYVVAPLENRGTLDAG